MLVHDFSNEKLYPDLKFISFYKKQVRLEIEKCVSRGGGGYLNTVRGTGTCHFLGVLFSNHYGIMGIIFTIF